MMRLLANVSNRLRYEWLRPIEPWLGPDQRWRQQNKIAVVSSLLPMCPSSRKGKGKGKVKGKSKDSSCETIISGDSVLNDIRKDQAREVKMYLTRFIWELLGVLILKCLRQWCFKRMLSWIMVRQKTGGGVEAVQIFGGCSETRFFLILVSGQTMVPFC